MLNMWSVALVSPAEPTSGKYPSVGVKLANIFSMTRHVIWTIQSIERTQFGKSRLPSSSLKILVMQTKGPKKVKTVKDVSVKPPVRGNGSPVICAICVETHCNYNC